MFQVLQMNGMIYLLQCDPQVDQTGVFRCVREFDGKNNVLFRVIDLKTTLNDIAEALNGDFDPFAVVQIVLDLVHMSGLFKTDSPTEG